MNPIKIPALFAILLALPGAFAACATGEPSQQEANQARVASELKEELEVGRAMAAKIAGTLGWYDGDPALLAYVNLVGRSLAAHGNRPEVEFHFGILKSEDVNALATPGGYVFVTMGLLRRLRTESELAGVLGHEIVHVDERHMYNVIMPKHEVSAGESLTRMLSRGGSDVGQSLSQIVNAGMEILLDKGLGQQKESEADTLGAMLAASEGYDPAGLRDVLVRLGKADKTGGISKTHPPFPERISVLDVFFQENGLQVGVMKADQKALKRRFGSFEKELPEAKL